MGLLGFIDSGVTPPSSPVEPPPGIEPSYHDYKSCASPAMLKRLLWKTEDGGVDICFYDWRFSLLLAPLNPNQPLFYKYMNNTLNYKIIVKYIFVAGSGVEPETLGL